MPRRQGLPRAAQGNIQAGPNLLAGTGWRVLETRNTRSAAKSRQPFFADAGRIWRSGMPSTATIVGAINTQ
jgi:hypothetical protein